VRDSSSRGRAQRITSPPTASLVTSRN
jgi:hypothetical protein